MIQGLTRPRFCASLLLVSLGVLAADPALSGAPTDDLAALSLEDLMRIGVTGASRYEQRQADVAASVSIITRQEIQAHGWQTIDEALSSLPGVTSTYDRQFHYPNLRGFGLPGDYSTRVLVTINGNRLNDPVQDQGPFGRLLPIDMDLVERIEYIPGPGGAVYGANAMFGVVNVVTRSGAEMAGLELSLAATQPQRQREGRISWGQLLAGGTDVLLSASVMQAEGEDRFYRYGITGASGVAAGLDYERDHRLLARAQNGAWKMEVEYGSRRKGDPTANYSTDPLVRGKFIEDDYGIAQVQHEKSLSPTLQMATRVFAGDYRSQAGGSIYGTPFHQRVEGGWIGADLQLLSNAIAGHKLMLGLEYQNDYRRVQALHDADLGIDIYVPGSGYRAGLYGQDEWLIVESLSATLGARIDKNNTAGAQLSPRLGLIWQASSATTVKALFGRAHRSPNAFERDYANPFNRAANPDLDGEDIDTVELSTDHRFGSELGVRVSLYQWELSDIITLAEDAASGLQQYQSGSLIRARGIEVSFDRTWAANARLRGSVSRQHVQGLAGKLPNSPDWLLRLAYSRTLPWTGLSLGAEWQYDSSRRTLDGTELGGWGVTNLDLKKHIGRRGLELSMGVSNLFDKRYAEPASALNWQNSLDQDGRSVGLKLDYHF